MQIHNNISVISGKNKSPLTLTVIGYLIGIDFGWSLSHCIFQFLHQLNQGIESTVLISYIVGIFYGFSLVRIPQIIGLYWVLKKYSIAVHYLLFTEVLQIVCSLVFILNYISLYISSTSQKIEIYIIAYFIRLIFEFIFLILIILSFKPYKKISHSNLQPKGLQLKLFYICPIIFLGFYILYVFHFNLMQLISN